MGGCGAFMKKCCFIGHRKIDGLDAVKERLRDTIEKLIISGVDVFAFGSKSDFNDLCYEIVSELKEKYTKIVRVNFTCAYEGFCLESEKEKTEETFRKVFKKDISLQAFEQENEFKNKYCAGRASYVERNQAMIDFCDVCVFYYNKNYLPPMRKFSKHDAVFYQPKSGTAMAYKYAKQKHKQIINLYKN